MTNNLEETEETFIFVMGFLMCCIVSATIGGCQADKMVRNEAVKNNVAQWVADENGAVKFQWKILTEKGE